MNRADSKLHEALSIIRALGFPTAQQNERSALSFLALLNLTSRKSWAKAENPLIGITPIMSWVRENYQKEYAPNTRETFRRHSIHQFCESGLVLRNPDCPARPVNSPKTVYQIEPAALRLLRTFKTRSWEQNLESYLGERETLVSRYAKKRHHERIAVKLDATKALSLSPGEHSELIKRIIEDFAPRFIPDSILIYVGDTEGKLRHFNRELLAGLGVAVDIHGKMPDVIFHHKERNWLILVESATTHGPVDSKRHSELAKLFSQAKAGLVYVTAFPNRSVMKRYLSEIAWETEVWVADAPSHLIHFNGERFLGPYKGP